jgi:multicomponent Na+:H+ antiporter subunit B
MNIDIIVIALLIFIIIGALIAVETPNLISSVICLGTIDIGFTIMFLFLKAPDIAITQMVVEVVCLVILIRATIRREKTQDIRERKFFGVMVASVVIVLLFILCLNVIDALGEFGDPVFARTDTAAAQTYLQEGLKDTGAANTVASIILDYRGYDTLGEATILFASVVGAVALLRKKPRKELDEPDLPPDDEHQTG